MLRLKRTPENVLTLFLKWPKPFVMVIENFGEECIGCLSKAVFPGKSFMVGTRTGSDTGPDTGYDTGPDASNRPDPTNPHSIPTNPHSIEIDRRVRVLFIETIEQWKIARHIAESFHANTILYAQTPDWGGVASYLKKYNPLFQELIELSPTKKVYGIKLEDLKRTFACKTAWENKDWICIEESEGEIPGAAQKSEERLV